MNTDRKWKRFRSNNWVNPNKNLCGLKVCEALQVAHKVKYLHTIQDVKKAIRLVYSVRSVKSKIKNLPRNKQRKILASIKAEGFLVQVCGHVLLLNSEGYTKADSAGILPDDWEIIGIWGLYNK